MENTLLPIRHDWMIKGRSAEAVEVILDLVKEALISGDDLLLSGFGKFSYRDKHERRGRNSQTGDEMMFASRRVVTFHQSRYLRDKVNGE